MTRWVRTAALTALLGLTACEDNRVEDTWSNASGPVALSRDDALLYVADSDNGILAVVDAVRGEKVGEVKVGALPERVTVGPDDTVYVSNRGDRSVSVVRRGDWTEAARLPVGVEPMGLAVSPKGDTLYVVNSTALDTTAHGTLMAFDTRSLSLRWELPLGEEPRGIALTPGGKRAFISLFRRGDVVEVDLSDSGQPRLSRNGTDLYSRANVQGPVGRGASDSLDEPLPRPVSQGAISFRPRGMADILLAPDGQRLFAPTMWAREDPLSASSGTDVPMPSGDSLYGGGGPCNTAGVVAPGLVTFDTGDGRPIVDDLAQCKPGPGEQPDFPTSTIVSPESSHPIQGPVAAVVDPTGLWLFVVNHQTDNVAILPTNRREGDDLPASTSIVRQLVRVGSGPTGIAVTRDGRKVFIYNAFDHTVSTLANDGSGQVASVREAGPRIRLAGDTLEPQAVAGRKLFFSALDSRMTSATVSASCGSCHLDGRDDGHVWGFPDGPRQTPSLAGRKVTETGPFHWSGEFATLRDFMDATVRQRMGGTSLDTVMVSQLSSFIDVIPTPDNPYRHDVPTEAQARGAQVFKKAGCDACHAGASFTNNQQADVGTFVVAGVLQDEPRVRKSGLNTPSLLGLARTAPYLHDGSAATLKDRLLQGRETNQHGTTGLLSDAEVNDLVEYLESL